MFYFDDIEDYHRFMREQEYLFGEGTYNQAGKHSDNVVLVLPDEETYNLARQGSNSNVFDRNADYHKQKQAERLNELLTTVGQPPEGVSIEAGTDSFGKGAEGLPQQFIEFLTYSGGVYGGVRAFYDIGKYLIAAMKQMHGSSLEAPLLNKAGVVAVCAVDLVDHQGVEDYILLSALEAQEGHRWDPILDPRDVYYVTFMDKEERNHLYIVNAKGTVLHYFRLPVGSSDASPSFLREDKEAPRSGSE